MAGYRPLYTVEEEKKIIEFLLNDDDRMPPKGDRIWKNMEEDRIVPNRTWQSLKNRWAKHISQDLGKPMYGLSKEEQKILKRKNTSNTSMKNSRPEFSSDESDSELSSKESDAELSSKESYSHLPHPILSNEESDSILSDEESDSILSDEESHPILSDEESHPGFSSEESDPGLSSEEGGTVEQGIQFYSLDVNWSDGDTE